MLLAKNQLLSYFATCARQNDDPDSISQYLFEVGVGEYVRYEPSFGDDGAWIFTGPGTEWSIDQDGSRFKFSKTEWAVGRSSGLWPINSDGAKWWGFFCRSSTTGEIIIRGGYQGGGKGSDFKASPL